MPVSKTEIQKWKKSNGFQSQATNNQIYDIQNHHCITDYINFKTYFIMYNERRGNSA